jgi:hypothetical protein
MLSHGARISYDGLTGGKILPTHGHLDREKDWFELLLGLVLFRLVVPPLQPGVVGTYPVWVFDSLAVYCWREMGHIQIYWAITNKPRYPGYRTLTTFHMAAITSI